MDPAFTWMLLQNPALRQTWYQMMCAQAYQNNLALAALTSMAAASLSPSSASATTSPTITELSTTDASSTESRASSTVLATREYTPQLQQLPTPYGCTPKTRSLKRGDTLLWMFILECLADENKRHLVEWTREDAGEFRFVDPEGFAQLWGEQKGERKTPMRFEVMTRGLRFYYKKGIIEKVKHHKHLFRFLKIDELKRTMQKMMKH